MRKTERPAFEFLGDWGGRFIATAIHNGHDVRPDFAAELALPEPDRLREEDPHTDEIGGPDPRAGRRASLPVRGGSES
jgi:N-formylglutamate deformylase